MTQYKAKLLSKREVADGTIAFEFEKPEGFTYTAGQSIDMTLFAIDKPDPRGNMRPFSLASAPSEKNLMIASRMTGSAFKETLRNLPMGTEIGFDGPFGSFTLHRNADNPAVFLIGGIGITPVRSMLVEAAHANLPHKLFLFFSNRQPKDAPFLEELMNLNNPNYKFVGTMTDTEAEWNSELGYITNEMISKYIEDKTKPVYYLVGPAKMVSAMRKVAEEVGADPDKIKTEEFTGYN